MKILSGSKNPAEPFWVLVVDRCTECKQTNATVIHYEGDPEGVCQHCFHAIPVSVQ